MIRQYFPTINESNNIDGIITEDVVKARLMQPLNDTAVAFLNDISKSIFTDKLASSFPELSALAFFLRRSSIQGLADQVQGSLNSTVLLAPRGVAFHIAPSNVDTIFAYSWALSLLAGNINIVRVSSRKNQQVEILLDIFRKTAAREQYSDISNRNIVINYEHEDLINKRLSSIADMRVVWGGDSTISLIRSFQAKPTTKEITFADKVSYSIIDSESYLQFEEKALEATAAAFYNDGYYFGQMGCSSPRIVYFSGSDEANANASVLFWSQLSDYMKKKGHRDDISVALNKHIEVFEKAAGDVNILSYHDRADDQATVVRIDCMSVGNARETCGGGFFYECFIGSPDDIIPLVQANDQTLTYTGFSQETMRELASKLAGKGIDRMVPVGSALNFAPVWDGYNLMIEFTKSISVL